jgi:hypothetical protein
MNALTKAQRAKPNAPPPPAPLTAAQITEYLEYAMTALLARRTEIIAALAATAKAYPRIDDDDTLGEVAENVRMANALTRSAEDKRKTEKAPFLAGERTVDGWFKTFGAPIATALQPVQAAMNDYGARKLADERAKAEKARKDAEAEEARALAAAAEAMRNRGPNVDDALATAAEASKVAEQAGNVAMSRPAALTKTRGMYGASASVRTTWRWEVTDFAAIPRAFLMVDENAIKEAVRDSRDASGKPTIEIAGIRFVPDHKTVVR